MYFCQPYSVIFRSQSLGRRLSSSEANAKSIQEYQRSKTKKQLRRFFGMTKFYSKFIPRRFELLQPIYNAIGKNPTHFPVAWTNIKVNYFE